MNRPMAAFVLMIVAWSGSASAFAQDEQAVQRLQDRGLQVIRENQVVVAVKGFGARDGDLKDVRQFPKLRVLELTNSQITDEGLAELAELKNLQEIQLNFTQTIKGGGLKYLVGNKNLKDLHVDIWQINDDALRALRKAGMLHALFESCVVDRRPERDDEVRSLVLADGVTDAGLEELVGLPAIQSLSLWGPNVTDRSMAILGKMPTLRELGMRGARITDAGLKEIAHLKDLEVLLIDDAPITDEGLKVIGGFKSLKTLYLKSPHIKGEGFRHLAGLPLQELWLLRSITDNSLRVLRETGQLHCLSEARDSIRQHVRLDKEIYSLDLSYQPITAAGLKELKDLPNLRILRLSGARIKGEEFVNLSGVPSLEFVEFDVGMVTDEALRTLRQHDMIHLLAAEARGPDEPLKSVRAMRLAQQPITDEGLKVLRMIDSLTELDLSGTSVSDAGVKDLKEMPALEKLNLHDTRVTNQGLASLLENKKLKRIDLSAKLVDDETLNLFHKIGRLELLSNTRCERGEQPSSKNVIGIALNNTAVTDEGLKLLKAYPKLAFINVRNSRVTDAGVAELLRTFPKLRVIR